MGAIGKVVGDTLTITKSVWNDIIDCKEWWKRNVALGSPGATRGGIRNYSVVSVQNSTGGALRLGDVVELDDRVLSDSYLTNDYLWFDAKIPTFSENRAAFAVMLEPVPSDSTRCGKALTFGTCLAYVDVVSTSHKYAELVTATKTFKSSPGGPVKLLSVPDSTGEQLVYVALGEGKLTLVGKPGSTISKGNSGSVAIWTKASGSWAATSFTLTAEALGAECPSGIYCTVQFYENRWLCGPMECDDGGSGDDEIDGGTY